MNAQECEKSVSNERVEMHRWRRARKGDPNASRDRQTPSPFYFGLLKYNALSSYGPMKIGEREIGRDRPRLM